ncbi:carboxypeptidase A4-like [Contarinia nasturtii]|uniref:carboxypeptidase A4-like n=1 Tax=Contarinia nasturtii TaxID=265458 RepID=UPI0012D3CCB0|nr:carboxypeptidase A4-like [Contarinia nasturtii]
MSHIFKIVMVLAVFEYHVIQSGAAPSNSVARQFTVAKPTFISTAQFIDRCVVSKMCTRTNIQSQFARARISTTNLPSLKVKSMLHGQTLNQNSRRTPRGKEVIDAVKKNDLIGLSKLITSHVDVNERDNGGMTGLHWAAENGHIEAAKMLIENNAEIDARDNYFNTPLHIACSHDFFEMIELLIDRGAHIHAPNLNKLYPLKLCTISIENLRPCLLKAAEKGHKLFDAVESGDLKLVQKLIGQGVNINFGNPCGETALNVAILKGNKTMAGWLVNNGADVNLESCDGTTPLELAKNAGMSLPQSKTPDWESTIEYARKTVNKWLVDNPSEAELRAEKKRNGHYLSWIAYHPLLDIFSFLNHLRAFNSKICSVHTILDFTHKGKKIELIKISNGNPKNKVVWIDGGIHGCEMVSVAAVTFIANELIKNWNEPHIQNIDWYILPIQNPEGYDFSLQFDRFWRKNRSPTDQGSSAGVDVNRNYDFEWGNRTCNSSDDTYGGPRPFSECESSAVKKFVQGKLKGKCKAFISFQSYGQYVMYSGDKDAERVGKEGAKRMKAVDNKNYKAGTGLSLFNSIPSGFASEWARSVGIKYSYTVNLRDTGRYGYVLPPSFIQITAKEAQAFVWTVAEAIFNESK